MYYWRLSLCLQWRLSSQTLQARLEGQPLVHISTCPAPKEQRMIANTSLDLLAEAQEAHSGGGMALCKLCATPMLILSRFESCVSYKTQWCDSVISDHDYWKLELSEYFRDTKCIDVHVGDSILGPGPTVDEIRYTCSVHAGIYGCSANYTSSIKVFNTATAWQVNP